MSWLLKAVFLLGLAGSAAASVGGAIVFWYYSRGLPDLDSVGDYRPLAVTRVIAKDAAGQDRLLGEFYKERRYVTPVEQIPKHVIGAFVAAEDDRFFEHQGVNLSSILRASIANFRAGQVVQGGSTITQQVAKSLLLTPERSFDRKIKEVILASRIERNLSKEQILYLYLNQIYLGHGAYGVQAASRIFFRKDVSQLTLAEAAILAGMPQAPGKYSPHLNPKRAKERQLYVLRRMLETGRILRDDHAQAVKAELAIYGEDNPNLLTAPYLVEHLRQFVIKKYGERAAYEDGLTLVVPAKLEQLVSAREALRAGLREVDRRSGFRGPIKRVLETTRGSGRDASKGANPLAEYLAQARTRWLEKKLNFEVLTADGRLDRDLSVTHSGRASEAELVVPGERLEVWVSQVDDRRKLAEAQLGSVRFEIPLELMRWARSVRDEKDPKAYRPEPTLPSRVLKRGDVVWVQARERAPSGVWIAALDQEPAVQGALVSLEARTGHVLALEGGYDFAASEFNRATQALRQAGSAFKPIIFSAALEKGFTPASVILDSPIVYTDAETGKWKPANFEERFYGDTTFRQALIKSRNVPTIKIVQELRVQPLIAYARRLGFAGQFNEDLSIALGSNTVSPLELTRIYAVFARLGRRVNPVFYSSIRDRSGNVLEEVPPHTIPWPVTIPPILSQGQAQAAATLQGRAAAAQAAAAAGAAPGEATSTESLPIVEAQPVLGTGAAQSERKIVPLPLYPPPGDPDQVLDPRIAYVMTNLMKEVVAFGTGTQAKSLGRPAAAKTGTTNDYLDAWFMGFTPQVVTGVWVGHDNQLSLGPGETGAKAALPIWLDYMKVASQPYPNEDFATPPGITFASIHPASGKALPANAPGAIREAFLEGTEPQEASTTGGVGASGNVGGTPGQPASGSPAVAIPADSSDFFKEDIQ